MVCPPRGRWRAPTGEDCDGAWETAGIHRPPGARLLLPQEARTRGQLAAVGFSGSSLQPVSHEHALQDVWELDSGLSRGRLVSTVVLSLRKPVVLPDMAVFSANLYPESLTRGRVVAELRLHFPTKIALDLRRRFATRTLSRVGTEGLLTLIGQCKSFNITL